MKFPRVAGGMAAQAFGEGAGKFGQILYEMMMDKRREAVQNRELSMREQAMGYDRRAIEARESALRFEQDPARLKEKQDLIEMEHQRKLQEIAAQNATPSPSEALRSREFSYDVEKDRLDQLYGGIVETARSEAYNKGLQNMTANRIHATPDYRQLPAWRRRAAVAEGYAKQRADVTGAPRDGGINVGGGAYQGGVQQPISQADYARIARQYAKQNGLPERDPRITEYMSRNYIISR